MMIAREDIIRAVDMVFSVAQILIFANVVMSWIPPLRNGPIGKIVTGLVDPLLSPIRKLVSKSPLGGGMPLDFSPIIALFLLMFLRNIVISIIASV
jgi:YggT family protein